MYLPACIVLVMNRHPEPITTDSMCPILIDLSTDGVTPSQQYYYYENAYRDHNSDPRWQWMLCLHYLTWKGERKDWLGLCWGDYGIFIQDQLLLDLASWPLAPSISAFCRTVILHEYGHHLNILDLNSDGPRGFVSTMVVICTRLICYFGLISWTIRGIASTTGLNTAGLTRRIDGINMANRM